MPVTCPSCEARYQINESKIKGKGAKITCPRCSHKFVVYKRDLANASASTPHAHSNGAGIMHRNFRKVGVTWKVRDSLGRIREFHELDQLRVFIENREVSTSDNLSFDSRTWVSLDTIDDLESYFEDTWKKAERGEIRVAPPAEQPTTMIEWSPDSNIAAAGSGRTSQQAASVAQHGASIEQGIRSAVREATPSPAPSRDAKGNAKRNAALIGYASTIQPQRRDMPVPGQGRYSSPQTSSERPSYLVDESNEHDFHQEVVGIHATVRIDTDNPAQPRDASPKDSESSSTGLWLTLALVFLLILVLVGGVGLLVFSGGIPIGPVSTPPIATPQQDAPVNPPIVAPKVLPPVSPKPATKPARPTKSQPSKGTPATTAPPTAAPPPPSSE